MAAYKYYIAKSLTNPSSSNGNINFHLRIAKDPTDNLAPFLDYDTNVAEPVVVERSVEGNTINYIVKVWLMETNIPKALIAKDWIFSEAPANFSNTTGKIMAYKRKNNSGPGNDNGGDSELDEITEDLIFDLMPAEYPAD